MNSKFILATVLTTAFSALAGAPPASTPALMAKGQTVFKTSCAICHGEKGEGNGPAGAALNPKARNFVTENFKYGSKPEDVFKTITQGSKGTSMAPFAHLSEEDRWALTYFVLSLKKK